MEGGPLPSGERTSLLRGFPRVVGGAEHKTGGHTHPLPLS